MTPGAALELLTAALSDPAAAPARLATVAEPDIADVIRVARDHAVEAWLSGIAEPGDQWPELAEQRRRFIAARTRTVAELRGLGQTLAELGCDWAVLKGQALAEEFYPRPYMRFGIDIDVLVDPRDLATVLDGLQQVGWQQLDCNWPLIAATRPGELRLQSPHGTLLDLHWHLLNSRSMRARYRLPTAELLARRRWLPSGLPTLDAADQLVHLGVHGASSGANKLLWLFDAGLAATRLAAVDDVIERARAAGAALALAVVLLRSRRYLGMGLPDEVIAAAGAGAAWQRLCRAVDQRSPLHPDPDEPALARAFARAVRPTVAASLWNLSTRGGAWLRAGAPHDRLPTRINDPHDPASPLFPQPDDDARSAYLRAIAAG